MSLSVSTTASQPDRSASDRRVRGQGRASVREESEKQLTVEVVLNARGN
jgi:hypothetical protein